MLTKADTVPQRELASLIKNLEDDVRGRDKLVAAPWIVVGQRGESPRVSLRQQRVSLRQQTINRTNTRARARARPRAQATSSKVGHYGVGELRANICEAVGIELDYNADEARLEQLERLERAAQRRAPTAQTAL